MMEQRLNTNPKGRQTADAGKGWRGQWIEERSEYHQFYFSVRKDKDGCFPALEIVCFSVKGDL